MYALLCLYMVYLKRQRLNPKYKEIGIRCTLNVYCWTVCNLFVHNLEINTKENLC
jgi:hypothetical protein